MEEKKYSWKENGQAGLFKIDEKKKQKKKTKLKWEEKMVGWGWKGEKKKRFSGKL